MLRDRIEDRREAVFLSVARLYRPICAWQSDMKRQPAEVDRDGRMTRLLRPMVISVLLVLPLALPAHAQMESREGIALQNQIYELRQQLQALQSGLGSERGSGSSYLGRAPAQPVAPSNDFLAQLLARVDVIEEQQRQLRGRVDEIQNQVQRQGADLGKRIDDLAFQVRNPQAAGAAGGSSSMPQPAPPTLPAASAAVPPSAAPPSGAAGRRTPELAILDGNAALARRDYAAAEQAAREVLSNNRTSPRAYDAQFLLAQALLGQRQYSQSAIAFDDAYNRSRKGAHAPEALLGLANSLIAINEKKAACDTLSKLRAQFPGGRPDLRDAIAAADQRGGCK
jgi:TolA-binding protein